MNKRVIVIGLDGATFDVIKPLLKEGKLPTFAKLLSGGTHGELMSTIQPSSEQAWASFLTGKNNGKHGVFDVCEQEENYYDITPVSSLTQKAKTFLKILSEKGRKVGAFNIPLTYPPEELSKFMIAGWPVSIERDDLTSPPGLIKEIKSVVGEYIPDVRFCRSYPLQPKKKVVLNYFRKLEKMIQNREDVIKYLLKKEQLDLFVGVFLALDRAQHRLWHYYERDKRSKEGNIIPHLYQKIDNSLARIQGDVDDEVSIFIISDHGFDSLRKQIDVNTFLYKKGFLKYKNKVYGFNSVVRKLSSIVRDHLNESIVNKLQTSILAKKYFQMIWLNNIDWNLTKAYSFGYMGNIRINLKGRQPMGIVTPEEYEKTRDAIIEILYTLRDPDTGSSLVDKVYKREELYQGPYVHKAPDIIPQWKDYEYRARAGGEMLRTQFLQSVDDINFSKKHTGMHKLNGIFIAKGPFIKQGIQINNARIIDVAPTILYALGEPIPEDMDGRVLDEIVEDDYKKKHPLSYCDPVGEKGKVRFYYPEKEKDYIKDKLRSLGYL